MLRICLLLGCLATVAVAQDLILDGSGGEPVEFNYTTMQATDARAARFYCLGYDTDPTDNVPGVVGVIRDIPTANTETQIWTLWLQFPMISFLDILRKEALFSVIFDLINDEDPTLLGGGMILPENICVGTFETINVAEYSEGVLLHIYFNPDTYNTQAIDNAFKSAVNRASGDGNDARVIEFRGRDSIFLIGQSPAVTPFQMNPPASNTEFDADRSDDPTFNAVIIYSSAGELTREQIGRDRGPYASNPKPINYGLEAGDVVFAVFGSIFLAILSGLIILGFFIHPFFLA